MNSKPLNYASAASKTKTVHLDDTLNKTNNANISNNSTRSINSINDTKSNNTYKNYKDSYGLSNVNQRPKQSHTNTNSSSTSNDWRVKSNQSNTTGFRYTNHSANASNINWKTKASIQSNPSPSTNDKIAKKLSPFSIFSIKTKTYIFGDSFAGIFTLLESSANVKVVKFKGATMKGLSKEDNENRCLIQDVMKLIIDKTLQPLFIFTFGQVDVHISFYYNVLARKTILTLEDYRKIGRDYVDFINSLDYIEKKVILAIYPTPVTSEKVHSMIQAYSRVTDEEANSCDKETWDKVTCHESQYERLVICNNAIAERCHELGDSIQFLSINNEIMDEKHFVNNEFQDLNQYNIHLRWEPLMCRWTEMFKSLFPDCGITPENLVDMKSTEMDYLKQKADQMEQWNNQSNDILRNNDCSSDTDIGGLMSDLRI